VVGGAVGVAVELVPLLGWRAQQRASQPANALPQLHLDEGLRAASELPLPGEQVRRSRLHRTLAVLVDRGSEPVPQFAVEAAGVADEAAEVGVDGVEVYFHTDAVAASHASPPSLGGVGFPPPCTVATSFAPRQRVSGRAGV